ncbi:GNAT family N-acetyltransferase [Pseudodesulfovibrio sediminis]|uniref:N-acetyltransferase domain-containing protein n=1 Tax=Pseudodesulfovibrio sediminis TaxID=2810563 RepID=A0ABN6EP52_9BACT|nr:GNAT family N-acetyltransferase [Pseudodesulfovibrio sediminis]BCS88186.1 hypothetical protein PSDVSF_14280 [Pseudodesulfovibrio sediminis]
MIAIRPATAEDQRVIRDIILQSLLASYAHFLPASFIDKTIENDRAGEIARNDGIRFAIAEQEAVPAGVMLLKENYVDHLWTHPNFMGQGVGSALLDHAAQVAAKAGHDRLTLDCFEKNVTALAFYRARGFALEKTYEAKILPGENACFLVKDLRG